MLIAVAGILLGLSASPPDAAGDGANSCKIEFRVPKPDRGNKLAIVAGAEVAVSLRISNLKKDACPDVVLFQFVRGDGAMAGTVFARPEWIDKTHVEYRAKILAPRGPDDYDLKAVPSPATASLPGAPKKEKYPTMRAVVR
jgi:hypothetical protein